MIVFLLFVGMFMETLAAILILVPVLLPVMYTVGADPTHVGIVVICVLSIGFMTPPLGENLFVASGIGGETGREDHRARDALRARLDGRGVHHRVRPCTVAVAAGFGRLQVIENAFGCGNQRLRRSAGAQSVAREYRGD